MPGDYDGDARPDITVFRPSSGTWFVHRSTSTDTATGYGTSADVPVPGDYDGNCRTDLAVFPPLQLHLVHPQQLGQRYRRGLRDLRRHPAATASSDQADLLLANGPYVAKGIATTRSATACAVKAPLRVGVHHVLARRRSGGRECFTGYLP